MSKRKRTIAIVILSLYAFTWSGGWIAHSRDLGQRTSAFHEMLKRRTIEKYEEARARGANEEEFARIRVFGHSEEGPWWRVNWCVPLLPGILLADSESASGPLCGGGTREIVLFYGFGSMELWRVQVTYRV